MRDIKDYEDKYKDEPFEEKMVEIRKKEIVSFCKNNKHKNILEIGCGLEPLFLDIEDYSRFVIVEPAEQFVKNAINLSKKKNVSERVIIRQGFFEEQIEYIKSLNIEFDIVILSSLLHEVDDPDTLLAAVYAVCGKDTVVHINVPNANSLHRLIAIETGMIKDVHDRSAQQIKMQRRWTYDMGLLETAVNNAGFCVLEKGSYFIKPFTHKQLQDCLDNRIIDDKVIEGLSKLIKYMPDYGAEIYVNVKKRSSK